MKSRLEWWCLRLDEGLMGKEEAGEARGGGLGWAPCGEQLCPPESTGELPEFERPEQISVVNHFLQPLDRSKTWVQGEKEAEERSRWEMMEWKEAVELGRQDDGSGLGRQNWSWA